MPNDLSAHSAILIMSGVTLATRLLGAEIMYRVAMSKRVELFLDALSSSVVAAIVATAIAQGGFREATAIALAGMLMLATGKAVLAMISGMAAAALWYNLIG